MKTIGEFKSLFDLLQAWKSHATLTLLGKQDLPPLATI